MNSKLITTAAIGATLLCTGTLAMAHDRDDRGWHNESWREHRWHEPAWRDHHPRWHREYYRYEPRWERHYIPAPDWRYRSSYPQPYARDGVSIILRGRIN